MKCNDEMYRAYFIFECTLIFIQHFPIERNTMQKYFTKLY